jgi:alpha-L-fucosidase
VLDKNKVQQAYVFIPGMKQKVMSATLFADRSSLKFVQQPEGLFIYVTSAQLDDIDTVIQLTLQ